MAKKKTQQAKGTNQQENTIETPTDLHPQKPAMEDPAEKLKQLNVMLLKETTERRLQVETLGKEKEALEAELSRSRSDLEAELSRAGEEVEKLEVEKGVLNAFVNTRLEEIGAEVEKVKKSGDFNVGALEKRVSELVAEIESQRSVLGQVGVERDEVRSELDRSVKEANGLKERVAEMGSEVEKVKKNREFHVGVLEKKVSELSAEIEGQKSVLSQVGLERDEVRSQLDHSIKEANGLKERVVQMGSEVEKVKKNREFHVGVLEKKVSELVAELESQRTALSQVGQERDEVRSELDHWVKEANGLKERVVEMGSEVETVKKNGAFNVGVLEKKVSELTAELESQRSVLSQVGLERDEVRSELEHWVKEANGLKDRVVEMGSELETVKKNREFHVGVLEKKVSELTAEIENQRSVLSQVSLERDEVRSDLDHSVKEANGLKERVVEMEERERNFREELGKLRNEHQSLIEEKEVKGRDLEAASREKDLLERNLAEKVELIESFKMQVEEIAREKSQIEAEKQEQQEKVIELGNNVVNLDEIVSKLQQEERLLQGKVREFEKKSVEAMEMEKEATRRINALVEENKDKETMIHGLLGEKSSLIEQLEAMKMESEGLERRLEALSREKNDVEEVKASQESEIASLLKEASKLRDDLSVLQHLYTNQEERNKQLSSELSHQRDAFEKALHEKENLKKNFDEKCETIVDLNGEVAELNKRMEENVEALEQLKAKHEKLQEEKSQIESHADSLAVEKDSLVKKLSLSEQCVDNLRLKVESLGSNSEQALALLKNTATMVSQSKIRRNGNEDMGIAEGKLQAEVQPFLAELEVIKKAFSNKERTVEDLNKKLDSLGNSVEEAHKKKSFWTLVSSATTVFAAISIAYASRGR